MLLKLLMKLEQKRKRSPEEEGRMIETLGCLWVLMNTQDGLDKVTENPLVLNTIALCLDSADSRVGTLVCHLLGAVCCVDAERYQMVMDAMTYFREKKHEGVRFQLLIHSLIMTRDPSYPDTRLALCW